MKRWIAVIGLALLTAGCYTDGGWRKVDYIPYECMVHAVREYARITKEGGSPRMMIGYMRQGRLHCWVEGNPAGVGCTAVWAFDDQWRYAK